VDGSSGDPGFPAVDPSESRLELEEGTLLLFQGLPTDERDVYYPRKATQVGRALPDGYWVARQDRARHVFHLWHVDFFARATLVAEYGTWPGESSSVNEMILDGFGNLFVVGDKSGAPHLTVFDLDGHVEEFRLHEDVYLVTGP
jgi:hypothetical protein